MIDKIWKDTFDHVYLISYAPYKDRRDAVLKEIERVGLRQERLFSIHYTFKNYFDTLLLEHPSLQIQQKNVRFNRSALNLALGHYSIMKESLALGYKRILIMEDDVAFLKDLDTLERIMSNYPVGQDIVLFDKVCPMHMKEKYEDMLTKKINDWYAPYDHSMVLWTTSCLGLETKGMEHICECQEKSLNVADFYTNHFVPVPGKLVLFPDGIKTAFSITSAVCQRPSDETISDHGQSNSVYQQNGIWDCNIKLEDYNL